jgi:hypothetical protein
MSRMMLSILMAVLVSRAAWAKCANEVIHIEGSIVGVSGEGLRIAIKVSPDPNWEPQPEIRIENGKFAGEVLFDSTKSEGRVRDNCSRVPGFVRVSLSRNDQQLALRELAIKKDFVKSKNGDYRLRSALELRPQITN